MPKSSKKRKKSRPLLSLLIVLLLLAGAAFAYIHFSFFTVAEPDREKYPIRGVDVSSYQGEIDWARVAEQDVSFAFIKATEGSGLVDSCFETNWRDAKAAGLLVGGYHFFSFESSGKTQAENFIATVPNEPGTLPPVIDVELYGDFVKNPMKRKEVFALLDEMVQLLTEHYGRPPVIYATQVSFPLYIFGRYAGCPVWMRNLSRTPWLVDREWTFWQYSMVGDIDGHSGGEDNLDLNVFRGSYEELLAIAGVR